MNGVQQILTHFYVNVALGILIVCLLTVGLLVIRGLISRTSKSHKEKKNKESSEGLEVTESTIINELNDKGDMICPRCGSKLVLRTAKKGDNAGNQFYGCSTFPKCRYIKNL